MKAAFLVYNEVLDERVTDFLKDCEINAFIEWVQVLGKSEEALPHLGNRTYPGHDTIRLIPFREDEKLNKLISKVQEFNKDVRKKDDEMRIYLLPLERIV